jgi:hypothetical protein
MGFRRSKLVTLLIEALNLLRVKHSPIHNGACVAYVLPVQEIGNEFQIGRMGKLQFHIKGKPMVNAIDIEGN